MRDSWDWLLVPIVVLWGIACGLFGYGMDRSCPEAPLHTRFHESYERQGRLTCVYQVEYIRPMHRQSYKLTAEERAMVAE